MMNETNIDAAAEAVRAAESAHAECLKWNPATMRIEPVVSDAELNAKFAAVKVAQKAYAKACRKAGKR